MFLYASPRKAAAVKHIRRNISYILRLTFCETYPKREKGSLNSFGRINDKKR